MDSVASRVSSGCVGSDAGIKAGGGDGGTNGCYCANGAACGASADAVLTSLSPF